MKNILLLALFLLSVGANAQPLTLMNQTGCAFYVTITAVPPTCNSAVTNTYFVGASSSAVVTPPAGWTFEEAIVHSGPFPTPSIPASYYAVISRPGPGMGWPPYCAVVTGSDPHDICGYDTDCTGQLAEICWDGSPTAPVITIVN